MAAYMRTPVNTSTTINTMNSENVSGIKVYSTVNYAIGDAQYNITDTEEVHSRLQSRGKYIYLSFISKSICK